MKLQLLFFALLICTHAYSQRNYHSGYIVKKDGSTENGLINLKGTESNTKKCEFKKDDKSSEVEYSPDDIAAYRITEGKYYVSKKVSIEDNEKMLFLQCLISGKASIYFTQLDSKNYYFLEKEEQLVQIDNDYVDYHKNGVVYQQRSYQYKGMLKYYFRDCPSVVEKINNLDFSKKSLILIAKQYHQCVSEDDDYIVYDNTTQKKQIQLGFDFSFGKSKLDFNEASIKLSCEPKTHYQFGINSQMNLDNDGSFNLKFGLRYYYYENEILQNPSYSIGTFPSDVYYKYAILKPEIQLKYKLQNRKVSPFFSTGLFTNLFVLDEGFIYNERFDETITFLSGGIDKKDHRNGMFGFVSEAGFETRLKPGNLTLSIFYERFLTAPLEGSYNYGLRFGYSFYLN